VEETLVVTIPPGVPDGQVLRLRGKGEVPRGGEPGDLGVVLHIRPDERFVREGADVLTEVTISMVTAALGGTATVPTLEDRTRGTAEVEVEPGTQPGDLIVRRGAGIQRRGGGRGDQVVRLRVAIPRELSDRQRELLRQLAAERGEEVNEPERRTFF